MRTSVGAAGPLDHDADHVNTNEIDYNVAIVFAQNVIEVHLGLLSSIPGMRVLMRSITVRPLLFRHRVHVVRLVNLDSKPGMRVPLDQLQCGHQYLPIWWL